MKATRFEWQHQTLLHLLVVGAAALTYLRDQVDIVWGLVRGHADPALLERVVFGAGALMMLASAMVETWARASVRRSAAPLWLGRILLALTVGLLLPRSGMILLLACESILILRLYLRERESGAPGSVMVSWRRAFQATISKWGLAITMILFAWTLQDRIAEIGAVFSVSLWLAMNARRGLPA